MNFFNSIIEQKDKYNSICLYPNVIQIKEKYETTKLNENLINILQDKFNKISNNNCITWQQVEYYYKNLIKIEKKFHDEILEINYILKSKNDFIFESNNLIVLSYIENINKNQFPSLSNYDKVLIKNFKKYNIDNLEILFVSQNIKSNNETTLYFEISNANNKTQIENLLSFLKF
jgi:hypothetical protein